jgi:hypothetical protein
MVLTFVKCTTVMIVVLAVTSSRDPLLIRWYGMDEDEMVLV